MDKAEINVASEIENDLLLAKTIAMVDGVAPSKDAERIMRLYANNEIDYETAINAIKKIYF